MINRLDEVILRTDIDIDIDIDTMHNAQCTMHNAQFTIHNQQR